MDHEVEHHVHVEAPGSEDPEALRLDEPGRGAEVEEGLHGRVEELHVPDRQHPVAPGGEQAVGLLQAGGDRLLHQQVLPPAEDLAAEARVIDGRHREHHRLDLGEQRLGRCEVTAAELGGHRLADLPPPVVDPRQPDAGQRGEDPGMVPPERTAPDHADRERLHSPASSSRPERPGRTRQTPRRLARIQSIR